MGSYFVSPVAYIVVGLFLLVTGLIFYYALSILMTQSMMAQMQAERMGPRDIDVPGLANDLLFGWISWIVLFIVPMLTMGVYAEERKRGTMELLMTSPVSEFQIVMGKFLAAFALYVAMLVPTLIYQFIMGLYSEPALSWRVTLSGYLGVLLLGAVLVAVGSFISSLTESQIIAGMTTFAVFILLLVLDIGVRDSATGLGAVLQYLSILRHFEDLKRGVIDTSSIIFYLTLSGLAVFLTLRSLDSMRWRRA